MIILFGFQKPKQFIPFHFIYRFSFDLKSRQIMLSAAWRKVLQPISRPFIRNVIIQATASDYEAVMDLVKYMIIPVTMSRSRSIDYYYAGCQIPEVMKVPFFVAVFSVSYDVHR